MAVYDRWHTKKPRIVNGKPVAKCKEHQAFPSVAHGSGDRWQVRWRDPHVLPPGNPQKKLNFPKKKGKDPATCADAADAQIQSELNAGTYTDPSAGKITVEEYAKKWRASLTGKRETLDRVDDRLAHIYRVEIPEGKSTRRRGESGSVIAGVPMATLARRPSVVSQWIKELEGKGLGVRYIGNIVDLLSTIFIAAIDDGIVTRNPTTARSVIKPAVPRKRVSCWTSTQVRAAGESLAKEGVKGRLRLAVDLGAVGGLRQCEIWGIAQEDFTFLAKDKRVHVRRQVKVVKNTADEPCLVFAPPKGDKERDFPLSEGLKLRVAKHMKEFPSVAVTLPWETPEGPPHTARLLFIKPDGRPYHRRDTGYMWTRARKPAEVPVTRENGMHVLRHTAASSWLSDGVDILKVAKYLGHEDPGFTLRTYTHFMPDGEDTARKAMDRFLSDQGPSAPDVPQEGEG